MATKEEAAITYTWCIAQSKWANVKRYGYTWFKHWLEMEPSAIAGYTSYCDSCPLHNYLLEVFGLRANISANLISLYSGTSRVSEVIAPEWMMKVQKAVDGANGIGTMVTRGQVLATIER